ncbi:ABC transporter ATP-binding protein [Corticicoccus populi]|uniref:ABC transporter ATP-binding protein n=1 Tax=Corticicoccus populi TaxID=1812821 RepID=A0ABW5WW18_9STAP
MEILKIDGLKKAFHGKQVIDGLTMSVEEGTIYGFIGNNGTGKTTTMKMILGLLKQDSGTVFVSGEQVTFGDTATNRHIGYLPDVPEFYPYMNAREYLNLCAEITDVNKQERAERIETLLKLVGLNGETSKIRTYSRGMKQRLGIAQALIHRPKLLICDEPTSALDPGGRMEILNILKEIKSETTVIFSTHVLTDVERICDQAGVLHEGKILQEFNLKADDFGDKGIIIRLNPDEFSCLSHHLNMTHIENTDYRVTNHSLQEVYEVLHKNNIYPESIVREKKSLEDVYLEVTK